MISNINGRAATKQAATAHAVKKRVREILLKHFAEQPNPARRIRIKGAELAENNGLSRTEAGRALHMLANVIQWEYDANNDEVVAEWKGANNEGYNRN